MTMTKKPRMSLASLGDKLAKKPGVEPSVISTPQLEPEAGGEAVKGRAGDGRKGILVRAKPEAWKALKIVAIDREITLQDLMVEAINDVLTKHGKPPVA